jgi:hypothetical protein
MARSSSTMRTRCGTGPSCGQAVIRADASPWFSGRAAFAVVMVTLRLPDDGSRLPACREGAT